MLSESLGANVCAGMQGKTLRAPNTLELHLKPTSSNLSIAQTNSTALSFYEGPSFFCLSISLSGVLLGAFDCQPTHGP